jgi:hypothetical protein
MIGLFCDRDELYSSDSEKKQAGTVYVKNTILSMVQRKSVLLKLQSNPTRIWDTFAEPNNLNNTE